MRSNIAKRGQGDYLEIVCCDYPHNEVLFFIFSARAFCKNIISIIIKALGWWANLGVLIPCD
jgi:hypothetical protein